MENAKPAPSQPALTLTATDDLGCTTQIAVELTCTCCYLPVHWQHRPHGREMGWSFIPAQGPTVPCGGHCSVFDLLPVVDIPASTVTGQLVSITRTEAVE